MSDIVQRLRSAAYMIDHGLSHELLSDAADEIERLRHDLSRAIENHSADLTHGLDVSETTPEHHR